MKRTTLFSLALAAGLALSPSLANAQAKVTLTTAKAVGAEFSFVTNPGKITVDWGDGTPEEITSTGEPITGELKGQTVNLSCDKLSLLDCSSNELVNLAIENGNDLKELYCFDNQLESLPVQACTALESLDCSNNSIANLSLLTLKNLRSLNCADNSLGSLSLRNQALLQSLICSNNEITSISVSGSPDLQTLWCQNNSLKVLDLSANVNLQSVVCDQNEITSINVSNCTKLVDFWCDDNLLGTLNVQKNLGLQTLSCSNNQLTDLKVPAASLANKALSFYCDGNNLTFTSMHSTDNMQNPENMWYTSQGVFSLPKNQIMVDEYLDMEYLKTNADGKDVMPNYVWMNGTVELVSGSKEDYTKRGSLFSFKKPFDAVHCEVTSTEYPGLTLVSEDLAVISEETGIQDVMAAYGFSYITNNGSITMRSSKPYRVSIFTVDGKQVWTGVVSDETRVSLGHGIFLINGMKASL